jgi:hypothetical protein
MTGVYSAGVGLKGLALERTKKKKKKSKELSYKHK